MFRFGVFSILVGISFALPAIRDLHPDTGLNVIELVTRHNYPIEVHEVVTEDGYILNLHRIPHGLDNKHEQNKPVVLLMHCLLGSSGIWVAMGPEKGLAFLLADLGYDVWMANARGSTYSRKHIKYDPDEDKKDFWEFSWNEIGVYDIPASIDCALAKTGQDSLYYIGHSQGTTSFYVMGSERPEYNSKIKLQISLAPAAYMSHMDNPLLKWLAPYVNTLDVIAHILGMYEFFPTIENLVEVLGDLCADEDAIEDLCNNVFFFIFGTSDKIDEWIIPVVVSHLPAGASLNQIVHYTQGIESAKFRKFDFGLIQNLIKYGQVTPPSYDITKITCPVALFYGSSDSFVGIEDVDQLSGELPNLVYKYLMPDPTFNHVDFLFAEGLVDNMYRRIFALLKNFP